MELEFYKKNNKWYANIPYIPEDLNEMVLGSDRLLEELSSGKPVVKLDITLDEPKQYLIKMSISEHDNEGAWYDLMGPKYNQIMGEIDDMFTQIWICNVTHEVFGEHPDVMYIDSIETLDNLPK